MLEKFGFYVFPWGKSVPTVDSLANLARFGEALGFDSVHIPYHLTLPTNWVFPDFGNKAIVDPLVALPAIIHSTERIRISLNTAIAPLLHPYIWAKYFATCDVMSGGRLIAGVAIGWWEEEFRIVGAPLRKRGQMTDESLEVMTRLWTEDTVSFHGDCYEFENIGLEPKPLQDPYPELLIGGSLLSAERAARYGKYLMPLNPTADEVRNQMKPKLRDVGSRYGNNVQLAIMSYVVVSDDPAWIRNDVYPVLERCVGGTQATGRMPEEVAIYGSPEQCAEQTQSLLDAGVDYFIIDFQYHGLESEDFARHHMERFVNDVVPLLH